MYYSRKIPLIILLMFSGLFVFGQFDTEQVDTLENKILYNKQVTYGVTFHNLGFGANFRKGKRITYFKTRMFEVEFVSMRSYKQIKLVNSFAANSRRYVYGKENDAFFLRAGLIWKKLLNQKPYWGGVEVRFIYGGGLSIGIAKPYYLYILEPVAGNTDDYIIVTERFDPDKHSASYIYGKAPFSNGLGEITLHPGLYLKTGLNFEYGTRSTVIKSLEVGVCADILPTGLSIMADKRNQIAFPGIYLNFSLGKRYNNY
ncbi:MAG: hypothetical protein Q8O72_05880 [Bacteroidales bacterium]|nr:hypothetical protein [Bacteroidales bacterium]